MQQACSHRTQEYTQMQDVFIKHVKGLYFYYINFTADRNKVLI
jgi:hypothetical protein